MIKRWEILENKWTEGSAYILGIVGENKDSALITKELASFCSLVEVKVPPFTHIFELLNVTDDDILQRIRTRIEELVLKSSSDNGSSAFSSSPVTVSKGELEISSEEDPLGNLLDKPLSPGFSISSSDGTEISIGEAVSSRLEETDTFKVDNPVPQEPAGKEEKTKEIEKEEKQNFFKKLFSFGRKSKEKKSKEVFEGPLPIEKASAETKNIVSAKAESLEKAKAEQGMRGVVVKGTAFPAEDFGAQKIKEVTLDSKALFEREQNDSLKAQVPLDDIFAAETICKFYDDSTSGVNSTPKIEKIVEPTPVPTPHVITITQNKLLEEKLKKESLNQPKEEIKEEEPVKSEEKPKEEPSVKVPAQERKQVPLIKETAKPFVPSKKEVKAPLPPENIKPAMPKSEVKEELKEFNKPQFKAEEQPVIKLPEIELPSKKTVKETEPVLQDKPAALPKVEVNAKDLTEDSKIIKEEAAFTPLKKIETDSSDVAKAQVGQTKQGETKQTMQKEEYKKAAKPIAMPQIKDTKVDGFDHTIQTSSIPVYKKSNWSIEMPIVPSYTLENMDMSSNRFAHAAAMSVTDNPGAMYNPFFVFGEGGCGKTHFLNAIGAEFAKKMPQSQIFITNGVRFSRGVQRAIEDNSIGKVKELLDSAKVLIIDDVHLTAVNETNREFISQVLNGFVASKKQLIIASKYPPQGLSRFEELTNFKLSQGWISELKPLRPAHFMKVYTKMAEDAQVELTEAQRIGFFGRENLTLGAIARDIKRAKVLRRRIQDGGNMSISYEQLLNSITAISGEDTTSQLGSLDLNSPLSIRRGENTNWGNFGFFFPKDNADKFKWIVYATMRRAKELGIKGGFNFALKSAYSTEHIIASAFKIANICDSKSLKAAVILGPDPKMIQPAIRDNFYDILSHMLEVMMIRCAIISYEDIQKPSTYVKVLGDVLK